MYSGINSTSTCSITSFTAPLPSKLIKENSSEIIFPFSPMRSSHRLDQHIFYYERYNEVIKRPKKPELTFVNSQLERVSEEQVLQLSEAVNKANFTNKIFDSDDFPFYALEAFKRGYIDEYQFGTIQLLWSIDRYHWSLGFMQVHSLFSKDGQPNPEAVKLITATISAPLTFSTFSGNSTKQIVFLTEQQVQDFFKEMKKAPLSEQHFFIVPDIQSNKNHEQTISQRINLGIAMNIFGRVGNNLRMIPSLGMMQVMLKVKYGEDAVKINPVLGISSFKKHMRKTDRRDMALHFPGVSLPSKADRFPAPWYDFTLHDLYHAILCSGIPKEYRKLIVRIGDLALEIMKENGISPQSPSGETLRGLFETAVDMEMPHFRLELSEGLSKLDLKTKFWIEISNLSTKVFQDIDFKAFDPDISISFYQRVAQKIIIEGEGAAQGLTEDSLEPAKKSVSLTFKNTVGKLEPLKIISNYVEQFRQGKHPRSIIEAGLKSRIIQEKILHRIVSFVQKNDLTFLKQYMPEEQFNKLPEVFGGPQIITGFMPLILAGVSLEKITSLEINLREKILSYPSETVLLLVAGASWEDVLALSPENFKKIEANPRLIAGLLESGANLDRIFHSQFLSKFLVDEFLNPIFSLLRMGATLEEIEHLPVNLQEVIFQKSFELDTLSKIGFPFKILQSCKISLIKIILEKYISVVALFETGFEIDEFLKMDQTILEKLIPESFHVKTLREIGVSREEILKMNPLMLEKILKGWYKLKDIVSTGVDYKKILNLDLKTLDKIFNNYLTIVYLLKEGLTFDEILALEENRYDIFISYSGEISEFVKSGVSFKIFLKMEIPLIIELCKNIYYPLLKVGYSFDWILKQLQTETLASEHWFALTSRCLIYFAERDIQTAYFTSLSTDELKAFTLAASKAVRANEVDSFTKNLLVELGKETINSKK